MLLTLGNIQSLPVIVPEIKIKPGAGAYVTARWGKRGQGEAHRMTAPQNHFIFKTSNLLPRTSLLHNNSKITRLPNKQKFNTRTSFTTSPQSK
jgi:hypothetical protein